MQKILLVPIDTIGLTSVEAINGKQFSSESELISIFSGAVILLTLEEFCAKINNQDFVDQYIEDYWVGYVDIGTIPMADLKSTPPQKLDFSAEHVAIRCKQVEMPLSPKECKQVADVIHASLDVTRGIKDNMLDEAIVYAHSASELKWEPVKYRHRTFWLRVIEKANQYLFVAPPDLHECMTFDYCGNEFNDDAEYLREKICFYATEEEISLSNIELLKLVEHDVTEAKKD